MSCKKIESEKESLIPPRNILPLLILAQELLALK